MNTFDQVKEIIKNSSNIVFFGGAGVSTASGLPDFRSATGLYNRKNNSAYSPEYMLSHEFLIKHPDEFMKYIKENLMVDGIKPNACHYALSKLEKMGKLKGIITQNIDSLHQDAKSKNVIELHGNIKDYYCMNCGKNFDLDYIKKYEDIATCDKCGAIIRPDVVLYGEGLNQDNISYAINLIAKAEVLIIGGTSLAVYPAAGLIDFYRGDKLILINMEATSRDNIANYILQGDISKIMEKLVEEDDEK